MAFGLERQAGGPYARHKYTRGEWENSKVRTRRIILELGCVSRRWAMFHMVEAAETENERRPACRWGHMNGIRLDGGCWEVSHEVRRNAIIVIALVELRALCKFSDRPAAGCDAAGRFVRLSSATMQRDGCDVDGIKYWAVSPSLL